MVKPERAAVSIRKVGDYIIRGDLFLTPLEWSRFDETVAVDVLDYAQQRRADQTVPICSCCYAKNNLSPYYLFVCYRDQPLGILVIRGCAQTAVNIDAVETGILQQCR